MTELLGRTVLESLVCIGAFTAFAKDNILWIISRWVYGFVGEMKRYEDRIFVADQALEVLAKEDPKSEERARQIFDSTSAATISKLDAKAQLNKRKFVLYIFKPIFLCPMCMSSTWGTAVYFLSGGTCWVEWIISIVAACGLTTVLFKSIMNYHQGLY